MKGQSRGIRGINRWMRARQDGKEMIGLDGKREDGLHAGERCSNANQAEEDYSEVSLL